MLTNQCLQQTLPDLRKGKFTYKLRQAVTLVTNGSDCWICSQFPTHSDGGIQMMGIPTPNIFSNGIPSAEIMLFLEGKAVQTFTDQQLPTRFSSHGNLLCSQMPEGTRGDSTPKNGIT